MASFEVERFARASVPLVWEVFTAWEELATLFPWSMVDRSPGPRQVGWAFTARTRTASPLRVDDPMVLSRWTPPVDDGPAAFSLRRTGDRVTGWADCTLTPHPRGTRVSWRERVAVSSVLGRAGQRRAETVNERAWREAVADLVAEAEHRAGTA